MKALSSISLIFCLLMPLSLAAQKPGFSREAVQSGLVRLRISTARYSAARPWSREVGSTYEVTGLVRPGNRILLPAGPVRDAVNIEVSRHGSYKTYPGRVLLADVEANLAMVTADPEFFQGLKPIPFSADPGPGNSYVAVRVDGKFNIESTEVTVSQLLPIADYGFTRLPVAIFRSDPRFEGGGLVLDENGIVGMIGFVDGQDRAEAVFASRLKQFQQMIEKAKPKPVNPDEQSDTYALPSGYDGFPVQGFFFSPLEDPVLRKHLGLNSPDGILITTVLNGCSVSDQLQSGDVLLKVDGYSVNPAGDYQDPLLGWQPVDLLFVRDAKGNPRKVGDSLALGIVRKGKPLEVTIKLRAYEGGAERIPWAEPGPPPYLVHEGFIFTELSVPFLKERFGSKWKIRALSLAALYEEKKYYAAGDKKDRIIVLSDMLPAESTRGYERFAGEEIVAINGKETHSLKQIQEALEKKSGDVAEIELRSGRKIYIPTGPGNPELRENYGIDKKARLRP